MELLDDHKVRTCCVSDNKLINDLHPTNPLSPVIIALMGAVAQIERDQIADRTRAGQQEAKKRGVHIGRAKRSAEEEAEVLKLKSEGMSYPKIAKQMNISTTKAWNICKQAS